MAYVKIKVIENGTSEDLQSWKDHMQEDPKCRNKFCFGCYEKDNLKAVHITIVDNETNSYLTTLCSDCIEGISKNDILVNEKHLMAESLTPLKKKHNDEAKC